MKRQKRKIIGLLVGLFVLLMMSGCSDFTTKSTWKIVNYTFNKMDITPQNDADCGTFTLYHNGSKTVTWEGHGEDYWSLKWTSYGCYAYTKEYSSLREIYFYKY